MAVEPARFREALARWASGVAVVAARETPDEGGRVLATTVTGLLAVAVAPPLVLVALGPGAQVLPCLGTGRAFAVSLLEEGQVRAASAFADPFPAGGPAFPADGDPWLEGSLVRLACVVERVDEAADHRLVLARVERAEIGGGRPLLRWDRRYRRLDPD